MKWTLPRWSPVVSVGRHHTGCFHLTYLWPIIKCQLHSPIVTHFTIFIVIFMQLFRTFSHNFTFCFEFLFLTLHLPIPNALLLQSFQVVAVIIVMFAKFFYFSFFAYFKFYLLWFSIKTCCFRLRFSLYYLKMNSLALKTKNYFLFIKFYHW